MNRRVPVRGSISQCNIKDLGVKKEKEKIEVPSVVTGQYLLGVLNSYLDWSIVQPEITPLPILNAT